MGLARGLERRLEQMVDGLAARLFRGRVHPVELGTRIVREADLAGYDTPVGPGAPNAFTVTLGGSPEPDDAVRAAEEDLASVLADTAAERGWRLEGPATVRIVFGGGAASSVEVAAEVRAGTIAPWACLESVDGAKTEVSLNRSVIGRSASADVHLASDDVSRRHALLWREGDVIWLDDLGSSNNTYLNGRRIEKPVQVLDGDAVAFGGTSFILRTCR